MATVSQPTSAADRRAVVMRGYLDRVRARSGTVLGVIATFFLFHPPLAQGLYYLLRGLWPLFRMGHIGAGSATDTDIWLAQSGGVLTLVIGAVLCLAAYRRQGSMEVIFLAFGSALGLTVLELIFVFQDRISGVYLLDAVIQVGLVASWVYGWRKTERRLAQAARLAPAAVPQPVAASQPSALPAASQTPPDNSHPPSPPGPLPARMGWQEKEAV